MRRFRMRAAWAWTLAACLAVTAVPVRAEDDDEDGAGGESLLPRETLVYFSIPSLPEFKEQLDNSLFGEMLKDPELQPFIDGVKAKIGEGAGAIKDEVGVSLEDILAIPSGEITFAAVELSTRKIGLVLLLEYGDHKSTVDTLLDKMEGALKEMGGEVEGEDVEGVNIRTFTFPSEQDLPFDKMAYFDHDEYLVLASDPEALKAILERWDGKSDDTFAEHDTYKYLMEKCVAEGQEPALKWFVNPIGLAQSVIGMMQAEYPQAGMALGVLPILGLDKLKALGGAGLVSVDDFDGLSKMFIYVDQPTTGILNLFQFPAAELAPPKWVPADVGMYWAMNWNVASAYSATEILFDSFSGPGSFGKIIDQMAEREDGPGLHLKKDVIDQLSGQIHVVMGESEAEDGLAPTPKMMFALDLKNPSKMNAVLAKAAKSDGFRGETRDFEGTTIYDVEGAGDGNASLAVAEKHLFIATDTALLENALRPRSEMPALAADPVYKKLAAKFPKKASMVGYQNGSSQLKSVYQVMKSGNIPGDVPEDVRELIGKLPDFEVLEKYLRANGSYTVPDKKGALTTSFTLRDQD